MLGSFATTPPQTYYYRIPFSFEKWVRYRGTKSLFQRRSIHVVAVKYMSLFFGHYSSSFGGSSWDLKLLLESILKKLTLELLLQCSAEETLAWLQCKQETWRWNNFRQQQATKSCNIYCSRWWHRYYYTSVTLFWIDIFQVSCGFRGAFPACNDSTAFRGHQRWARALQFVSQATSEPIIIFIMFPWDAALL